jgi:hypothetical protein
MGRVGSALANERVQTDAAGHIYSGWRLCCAPALSKSPDMIDLQGVVKQYGLAWE